MVNLVRSAFKDDRVKQRNVLQSFPKRWQRLIILSIWNLATSRMEQTYWLDICYRIFHKALSVYSGLNRKLNIWLALFGFFSGIICQDMSCHLITHSHSTLHFPFLVWFLKAFKHSFFKIYFFKNVFYLTYPRLVGVPGRHF